MKGTSKLLIVIGFVFVFVGMALIFSPIRIPQEIAYDLSPGSHLGTAIGSWSKGEKIVVNFTVSGGDEQIEFHIEDPTGTTIYNTTVKSRLEYEFAAELEGSYSFNFHNPQTEPEKTLTMTHQRMWSQGPDITLVSAGIIILFMVWIDFFKIIFPENRNDVYT
jgi:hypothetical protein